MDDFDKDQVIRWYEWLEQELLQILSYIPPTEQNLDTFSPRLASLVIEACGLLDSVLRQISTDPANIDHKRKPRKDLTIKDYARLYADKLQLPDSNSILLTTPPRYLTPFSEWKKPLLKGEYRRPAWWQIHTNLKHDRIANIKTARLEVGIQSLCALHLVIATLADGALARSLTIPAPSEKSSTSANLPDHVVPAALPARSLSKPGRRRCLRVSIHPRIGVRAQRGFERVGLPSSSYCALHLLPAELHLLPPLMSATFLPDFANHGDI